LLMAAVAVVSANGPGAFSARAVATHAQLPLAAVSYYFPRLDELLGEAIATVLRGWLDDGEQVVAATHGQGVEVAAAAITAALLPAGPPAAVRNRYDHLLAAAADPVSAAAVADLRPALQGLVTEILVTTGVQSRLTEDALIALVDGAAVGAVSEGTADPLGRVVAMLRDALAGGDDPGTRGR